VSRAALLAVALAALAAAPVGRADDPTAILLGVLPVEAAPGLAADAPLRVTLELNPPGLEKLASLREWFPAARADGGRATVELTGRAAPASSPPAPAQRGPTFLVDYDRPEAAAFREAVATLGGAPADAALSALVDRWIDKKTLTRGIDSAARVAARREGDCSEHAVLLAAAARLAGRPARVVIGVALVELGGSLRGFGHAWTEIHDGAAWRTADATGLPAGVRYLPLGVMADEGPGYVGAAWTVLSPIDVRRIVVAAAR
jgi:transglutaminase-like putative cysteine protease